MHSVFHVTMNLLQNTLEALGYDAVPDTTKENTVLLIYFQYSDKDTLWNQDSTGYSFVRLALFEDNKWRREERLLKILPREVILKRFATDLRVLLRAMGFGIG